jgi:hypothetical protein
MWDWHTLRLPPERLADEFVWEEWFGRIASRLLNGSFPMVGGKCHRFVEVEFYYHSEPHPDPFTHRDPLQRECGRWYFHRSRGAYRSGSFKGLDLTFGGDAFGGILIRSIESPDGKLIDGPSLCVDYLLAATGAKRVSALDAIIAGRVAWNGDNPLRVEEGRSGGHRPIFRSARIGLSLKKAGVSSAMPSFILRPYRYLTEPRRIAKGKPLLVLSLHAQGMDPDAIHRLTGCPRQSVCRYIADCEAGRQAADFAPYFGRDLSPGDLCRLHGTWHAHKTATGTVRGTPGRSGPTACERSPQ